MRQIKKNSNKGESLFQHAFSLEMEHRYAEAEKAYNKAINGAGKTGLDAGNAMFRIAWMAMNEKEHNKAVEFFQKAADTLKQTENCNKLTNEAIYWLALNYEALNQPIRALDLYNKIHADSYWFWDVSFRMVVCYDKIGKYEEALICCRKYLDTAAENADAVDRKAKHQTQLDSMHNILERIFITL